MSCKTSRAKGLCIVLKRVYQRACLGTADEGEGSDADADPVRADAGGGEGGAQGSMAGFERGAGRKHIIHQQQMQSSGKEKP